MLKLIKNLSAEGKENIVKIKDIFAEEGQNSEEVLKCYGKYLSGKGSVDDLKEANAKFKELLKAAGFGAFCFVPGTFITLPVLIVIAKKLGIDILPQSFYRQYPNLKEHQIMPDDDV